MVTLVRALPGAALLEPPPLVGPSGVTFSQRPWVESLFLRSLVSLVDVVVVVE